MIQQLVKSWLRYKSWKSTDKNYIVFESDDWGSLRIPDLQTLNRLSKKNTKINNDPYCRLDSLENSQDLSRLFEVLNKFRDYNGNHPVITANTIMANPDFKKIKQDDFQLYYFEPFFQSILKYGDGQNTLNLYKEGQMAGLFYPQLHGREHLNVTLWMRELRSGNELLRDAFDNYCFSVPVELENNKRENLMASFDEFGFVNEAQIHNEIIRDATALFVDYFGYHSLSFIAPTYVWSKKLEEVLHQHGIKYLQGIPVQYCPSRGLQYKRRLRYIGQLNKHDQINLVRNVFFEPWSNNKIDWVDDCLARINKCFSSNIPAIVGMHRINFIGSKDANNSSKNLNLLQDLLKKVLSRWENVEFISSSDLGRLISESD